MTKVFLTQSSKKDLRKIAAKEAIRILKKLRFFSQQKNPLRFAKKMSHQELGQYRFRVGDYRILFDVDKEGSIIILLILRVKHRREIYKI